MYREFKHGSESRPLCHRTIVSGRTMARTWRIDGNQRYSWIKTAVMVRQPDAIMQPTPQDNEPMSKHRVLSFKPQLRLEWRGQDGQDETQKTDDSASLVDSVKSSTRIG
jgi:hypothetical protein